MLMINGTYIVHQESKHATYLVTSVALINACMSGLTWCINDDYVIITHITQIIGIKIVPES